MSLFERLSRVARAEASYAKSQSVSPGQEVDRTIGMLQDAVIKTRLAIASAPSGQAEELKRNLADLETKLASTKAKRDELVTRMNEVRANQALQDKTGHLGTSSAMSAFERMEEKVREMEVRSQALINPGNSDNSDFETRLRNVERKLETMKNHLLEQQKTTSLLISQNSEALGEVRSLLAEARSQASSEFKGSNLDEQYRLIVECGDDVDNELASMKVYLTGKSASQQAQPNSDDEEASSLSSSEVDDELEALRKQIDSL